MAKRDYYEALGVAKGASDDEIKKLIVSFQRSIIQILTKKLVQKISLKKLLKPMKFLAMHKNVQPMINTVMRVQIQTLAVAVSVAADLVVLAEVAQVLVADLKIFLNLSLVAAVVRKIQMHQDKVMTYNIH